MLRKLKIINDIEIEEAVEEIIQEEIDKLLVKTTHHVGNHEEGTNVDNIKNQEVKDNQNQNLNQHLNENQNQTDID